MHRVHKKLEEKPLSITFNVRGKEQTILFQKWHMQQIAGMVIADPGPYLGILFNIYYQLDSGKTELLNRALSMGFFTEDALYHNMPVAPVTGTEAIRGVLQGFMGMSSEVDWVLHAIAENADGQVLTERTDRFKVGEGWVELPVMGIFELAGGKISSWKDYFDMQQFQSQLPGAS